MAHECHENFHVSQTSRELVTKFLNMFKNNIFRKTVARVSCECQELVAATFWQIHISKFLRRSYECRAISYDGRAAVLRKHVNTPRLAGETIKLSDIHSNVMRHSHECCETVVRMKMKIIFIRGKVLRHSHECLTTVVRLCETYFQN